MSKIIKVAIIGGIGSGKSEVVKILRSLGAYVLVADEINEELLSNEEYLTVIRSNFGEAVQNGEISKQRLRELIFADESKRLLLMSIAHPIIERIMKERTLSGINFYEIPLINECSIDFDCQWLVYSAYEDRIERVQKRSNLPIDTIKKIIDVQGNIQISKDAKIIDNSFGFAELAERVAELFLELQKY